MARIDRFAVQIMVNTLEVRAREAGLIRPDEYLVYYGLDLGLAPEVMIASAMYPDRTDTWIPEFRINENLPTQWRLLKAVVGTLETMLEMRSDQIAIILPTKYA